MKAGEFCNRGVVTIEREESIREAARQMCWNDAREVVVVDRGGGRRKPLGVLTDRDIVVELLAQDIDISCVCVGDVMNDDLPLLHEDEDLGQVLNTLRSSSGRSLVVVNGLGDLVGMVALEDVLDFLGEQLVLLGGTRTESRSRTAGETLASVVHDKPAAVKNRRILE